MPQIKKFANEIGVLVRMDKPMADKLQDEANGKLLSRNDYIIRMIERVWLQDEAAKHIRVTGVEKK